MIFSGDKKTNKYKQLLGIVPDGWWSNLFLCAALLLSEKRQHINKIPRKSQEKCRDIPGTIPGSSWDNPMKILFTIDAEIYSVYLSICGFVATGRLRQKSRRLAIASFGALTSQGPLNGGVSNGGVSRSGLVLPFSSFFVLFGTFPDFSGIFPICSGMVRGFSDLSFPLSRPIKSTYEEQSRKGPRHNLDLSRKKWETPGFGNPPV